MIEIQYDDHAIQEALQRLLNRTGNLRPALAEIGDVLTESSKQRFETLTAPDGGHWAPNSPVTVDRKGHSRPLSGETGALMQTIHSDVVDNFTVEIGSPMQYAAMMQFGGTTDEFPHLWGDIPGRPFLGISDQDKADILDIIQRHLNL